MLVAGCWGPGRWGGGVFFFSFLFKSEEVGFLEYFHAGLMAFYLHRVGTDGICGSGGEWGGGKVGRLVGLDFIGMID